MNFLIDESADIRLAPFLRDLGHDVKTVAHDYGQALPDAEILAVAVSERRVVITFDRDFGELIFRQGREHTGVLYFRLGEIDLAVETARLEHVLENYGDRLDRFLVVDRRSVRVK
jgi:predicted nuclease of predicted toxin-antitoxin system